MAKITKADRPPNSTITVRTKAKSEPSLSMAKWWQASTQDDLAAELVTTASYLKQQQQHRFREAAIYARLYGNMPIFNFAGADFNKMSLGQQLPIDRPTMNVIQSCIDTLVSRITQARPRPVFLTDNADYKQRSLAKQMNQFTQGEFFRMKAYNMGELLLRDASVLGTGCWKVYEDAEKRVALDRVLPVELLVDPMDAFYGFPRQMYQLKLVDRDVLLDSFPQVRKKIESAAQAFGDNGSEASKSVADQIMVVEAWRLPSSKEAGDGKHALACSSGLIFQEEYKKERFPFVFLHSSPRLTGFWGQGASERLMGTQVEINKLLITISRSINIMGVPRVFLEDGSKVVKAHINNEIGSIVTYRGTKPVFEVAPCMAPEVYAQLQRLIQYAYQQEGISTLAAQAGKPAGLNSGEALRNYDDLQTDRFAALTRRYDMAFIDLAYLVIDLAKDIAERDGSYATVYPNKDGTKEIDLPGAKLLDDPYVIQCFDASSLPRDPAGRLQKVTEMAQSGMISIQEARRLLDYPDLEQVDKLANAGEERILKILDEIVEEGKYTPPDPQMDLALAQTLAIQYYNLYLAAGLEESKAQKLRDFTTQIQALQQAAMPPMPPPGNPPQAVPQAPPVSDVLPNAPQ